MNTREYLRDLAKRQLALSQSPENIALREKWYAHNALQSKEPLVVFEEGTCVRELFQQKCETTEDRFLEFQLLQIIRSKELIGDDKVVPDRLVIPMRIEGKLFGVDQKRTTAAEGLGYHIQPVLEDLSEDLPKLSHTQFTYDRAGTEHLQNYVQDMVGDILDVQLMNTMNVWHFGLTQHAVNLMGMENMFYAMYDTPEEFHQLMDFLVEDCRRLLRWEEANGLLLANAGNDYMGSGSFCFNRELVQKGPTVSTQTWGHVNSQESVGISPEMYGEFIHPHFMDMAKEFGLLYYGCCEPVHPIWDDYVSKLPNLRKVSISAWCDEAFMAERLRGSKVIYSRKPSPNYLGVDVNLDEDAFRAYMKNTVDLTRDCCSEIIFRDIYTLHNNPAKARRAVEIVKSLI